MKELEEMTDQEITQELEDEAKRLGKARRDRAVRRASKMTRQQLLAALDRKFKQNRKRRQAK